MQRELGKIAKEIKLDNLFVKYNQKYRQIERKFKKNKRLIRAKKAQNITYNNILLNYHAIPTNEEIAQLRMELLPKSNTFNSNRNLYDNKIFQYWHQGDSLFKAEKCGGSWKTVHKLSYLSIERYYQDKHILIDYDSIYDYINFTPELNKTINNLLKNNRLASISDLFRTILLFFHCALRNENILALVVNNSVFGMTGGQMSPTSLPNMKTTSSPKGRDVEKNGHPFDVTKTLSSFDIAYLARGSVDSPAQVIKTGKMIKKALQKQMNGEGFCLVEGRRPCPTNRNKQHADALEFMKEQQEAFYPLGEFVDKGGEA